MPENLCQRISSEESSLKRNRENNLSKIFQEISWRRTRLDALKLAAAIKSRKPNWCRCQLAGHNGDRADDRSLEKRFFFRKVGREMRKRKVITFFRIAFCSMQISKLFQIGRRSNFFMQISKIQIFLLQTLCANRALGPHVRPANRLLSRLESGAGTY